MSNRYAGSQGFAGGSYDAHAAATSSSAQHIKHTLRETDSILRGIGHSTAPYTRAGVSQQQLHHAETCNYCGPAKENVVGGGISSAAAAGGAGVKTSSSSGPSTGGLAHQVKALSHEVDIERQGRRDDVKDLRRRLEVDVSRIDEAVHGLRKEQHILKQELQDVRRVRIRGGVSSAGEDGGANISQGQAIGEHVAGHNYNHRATALFGTLGSDQTLIDRVIHLENLVSKQQLQLDERHLRINQAVHEAVDTKIALEIEKLRTTAREAARTATEDLLSLKMNGISAAFGKQVLEVEHNSAGAISRVEEMQQRLLQVEDEMRDLTRQTSVAVSEAKAASSAVDIKDEIIREAKGHSELERQKVDAALTQLRGDVSSQLRKASSETLQSQQTLQQYIAQRMDTLSAQGVLRDEVQRMISQATNLLEGEVSSVVRGQASMKQIQDDSRADMLKRINIVEQKQHDLGESMSNLQIKEGYMSTRVTKIASDTDDLKTRVHNLSNDFEGLKSAQQDSKMEVEGLRTAVTTKTTKAENDIVSLTQKVEATHRLTEAVESKQETLSHRVTEEGNDRSAQIAKYSDSLASLQRDQNKSQSEVRMLAERVEAHANSSTSGVSAEFDAEHLAPMRKSIASMEAKVKESNETQNTKMEELTQDISQLSTQVGNTAKTTSNQVKEQLQRSTDALNQLETRLDDAVEGVNNDRRRDFEQMHSKLLEVSKKQNDLRADLEEVERKNQDGVAQALELHAVAQRTANEKATKLSVTELESRMVAVESMASTVEQHDATLSSLSQDVQRAMQTANTAQHVSKEAEKRSSSPAPIIASAPPPTSSSSQPPGLSIKDAQRLISDYVSTHVINQIESLQEQSTETALSVESVKNQTYALDEKVKKLEDHQKEHVLAYNNSMNTIRRDVQQLQSEVQLKLEELEEKAEASAAAEAAVKEVEAERSRSVAREAASAAAASSRKPQPVDEAGVKLLVQRLLETHELYQKYNEVVTLIDTANADIERLEVKVDENSNRIDNTCVAIDTLNQTVVRCDEASNIHQSYFEEVREKIEDLSQAVAESVEVVTDFIARGDSATLVADDADGGGAAAQHSVPPPPQTLSDCFHAIGTALNDQDQKSQLHVAHVISILKAHAHLLPQLVDVSNTYSTFFQRVATHCGLDPSEFTMELTNDAVSTSVAAGAVGGASTVEADDYEEEEEE